MYKNYFIQYSYQYFILSLFFIFISYFNENLKNFRYIGIALLLLMYFLHRVPVIKVKHNNPNILVCPTFGVIKEIEETEDNYHIKILLRLQDPHVQYSPMDSTLIHQKYKEGKFYSLYHMFEKSKQNEQMIYTFKNKNGYKIDIIQIAGIFAKRIIPFIKSGHDIKKGEEIGMITLGSRVDIILPKNNTKLYVKVGQYVYGSNTIMSEII